MTLKKISELHFPQTLHFKATDSLVDLVCSCKLYPSNKFDYSTPLTDADRYN